MTITKQILSGSVDGMNILVSSTGSAIPTEIHTATTLDEIYLYAANNTSASISCSILWGGTTEPNDLTRVFLNAGSGRFLVIDGKLLQNGKTVYAYATLPDVVVIDGFVNHIA